MASGSSRVLIADDEPQLLRVLVRALEKDGYAVVTAHDGDEAIRVFLKAPDEICAVVIDAAIGPHGAASVLTTVARERPELCVVLTSGDQLSDTLRDLLVDHDGIFLRKPFPPSALLRAVEHSMSEGDVE